MRRKDKEMDAQFAMEVVDHCDYATVGMVYSGAPYCVMLSVVRVGGDIYFHSAKLGLKIDALRENSKICLTCASNVVQPNKFTTWYDSATIFGTAIEVCDVEESTKALRALCEKYAPNNMAEFGEEMDKSFAATSVWKIKIASITGKQGKPKA